MYIVFDLEWNIANPYKKNKLNNAMIPKEEIIEIGAWRLDEQLNILDSFSTNVKANFFDELHKHVAKVTQRDKASLKTGLNFPEAFLYFTEWCKQNGEPILFCTWSNNDVRPWISNLEAYNLQWPLGMRFFDAQRFFSLAKEDRNIQNSVATALEFLEIEPEKDLHKALNDAWYTAIIFQRTIRHLQKENKISSDPKKLFAELYKYSYDINLNYRDKFIFADINKSAELIKIAKNTDWQCPACKTKLNFTKNWKPAKRGMHLNNSTVCPEHGTVLVNLICFRNKQQRELNLPFHVKADVKIDWMVHSLG